MEYGAIALAPIGLTRGCGARIEPSYPRIDFSIIAAVRLFVCASCLVYTFGLIASRAVPI